MASSMIILFTAIAKFSFTKTRLILRSVKDLYQVWETLKFFCLMSSSKIDHRCLVYFDPKKDILKSKATIDTFLIFNNRFLRKRGMASTPKMEYQIFLCIFQKNSAMATLSLKEMGKFLWEGREKGLPYWLSQFSAKPGISFWGWMPCLFPSKTCC